MTEDEAKTKWCPFYQMVWADNHELCVSNRDHDDEPDNSGRCLGSLCMAWRWEPGMANRSETMRKSGDADGYCGLAEQP